MFSQRKTTHQDFGLHGQAAAMPHLARIICIRAEITSFVNYPYSVASHFPWFSIKYRTATAIPKLNCFSRPRPPMCFRYLFQFHNWENKTLFTRAVAVSKFWTTEWAKWWRNLNRKCYVSCCKTDRTQPKDSFPNYRRSRMDVIRV